MSHPNIEAGGHHPVPGPIAGIIAFFHHAAEINAPHTGKAADDLALARGRQGILVIDTGIGHPDQHISRVQLGFFQLDKMAEGLAFHHFDKKGLERLLHGFVSLFLYETGDHACLGILSPAKIGQKPFFHLGFSLNGTRDYSHFRHAKPLRGSAKPVYKGLIFQ